MIMTFNSRASDDPAFRIKRIVTIGRPIGPEVVSRTLEVEGSDGSHDFGANYGPGTIPVRIYQSTSSVAEELESIRAIAAWLTTREVKPLIFSDEPDKQYYARRAGGIRKSGLVTRRFLDITFICPDPHAYAANTKTASPNNGTAPTPVKITVTMTDDTDHLQINLGDQHIRLETALAIGDEVIIDTNQGWVELNGLDARRYLTFDSDLFHLPVGTFSLTADDATLTFVYRERWL